MTAENRIEISSEHGVGERFCDKETSRMTSKHVFVDITAKNRSRWIKFFDIMLFTIVNCMYIVFLGIVMCARTINKDGKVICKEIPTAVLEEVLGPAYNARYMSIGDPAAEAPEAGGKRRGAGGAPDFYVDGDLGEVVDEQPAWAVKSHVDGDRGSGPGRYERDVEYLQEWNCRSRICWTDLGPDQFPRSRIYFIYSYKRDVDYLQEWNCRSRIKWTDLGPDYFPRYLRSVECLVDRCWFDIYECRPRSFAVKILRRRRDRCVTAAPEAVRVGAAGLPRDLRELWVWEERAVSFCCDCTM